MTTQNNETSQHLSKKVAGVLGFFDEPEQLISATQKVREARYEQFDAYTPYPVHGLDQAQGLKRSPIPYVTFFAGLTGGLLGFSFEYWTSAVDWPLIVGGKPFNSWPAFVPIMFECTVLFAGLSTLAAMLFFNGLPYLKKRFFTSSMLKQITSDRFALVIEAPQNKSFDEAHASALLKTLGAKEVQSVYAEGWF